jgi:hypothetical protein
MEHSRDNRIDFPNFLLIAGNGRNVGKTWLACQIIEKLSQNHKITAIKISAHFHTVDEDSIIVKNNHFMICSENGINTKDSSLMLQAGAEKVYFIMASPKYLNEAFHFLKDDLINKIVVCESGGLIEIINPGLFLFVMKDGTQIQKPHLLHHSPIIIKNSNNRFDFDISRIAVSKEIFTLEA